MGRSRQIEPATAKPAKLERANLRVLVASPNAIALGKVVFLLRSLSDFDVTSIAGSNEELPELLGQANADVIVLELDASADETTFEHVIPDSVEIVVLISLASAALLKRIVAGGIKGILPHDVSAKELVEAIRAVAEGLIVLSPEFAALLATDDSDESVAELDPMLEPLTPREQDVLSMMAEGLLNKEIADRLHISEHTVKFHVSSIMGKLDASSRTEAVMRGIRSGIVIV
jgi:DNA-binding NarL/FixJ family response regulator